MAVFLGFLLIRFAKFLVTSQKLGVLQYVAKITLLLSVPQLIEKLLPVFVSMRV